MRKLVILALAVFCVSTAYSQATSSASSGAGSGPTEMVVEKKAGKVVIPRTRL